MIEKEKTDHSKDFAKQLDSLQSDWQNIKKVAAGPRLDIIDEAQRERDTTDKKPEDALAKHDLPGRVTDIRDFVHQARKPTTALPVNAPPGKPLADAGSTGGAREPRVFDINKAFEELDDIKSKIGSARASKPKVVAPNNLQKPNNPKLMNSPSDTIKSSLTSKESVKTAPYRMAESMRLPSSVEEQRSEGAGDKQLQVSWSAVQKEEAHGAMMHQPEWDSHQLISPGKQEEVATSILIDSKQEAPKRNLENIMTNKKASQPVISSHSELSTVRLPQKSRENRAKKR